MEMEMIPRTPAQEHRVSIPDVPDGQIAVSEPSISAGLRAMIQFITLCFTLFLIGWIDGSTGPLLPRIQSVYHVLLRPSYHSHLA